MQEEKNVRPDFAKLPADSEFYQPEDRRTTREKLKGMDTRGKISFIVEYYGINILVAAALIGIVLFLIIHFAFGKDVGFSILAVNTAQGECPADEASFYSDFLEDHGFNFKKEEISVNAALGVSATGEDSASESNLQTIQTRLMAGSVDIFMADENLFYSVGEFEYLADLNNYLPPDVMDKYKDDLVYVKGIESGRRYPVGIRISSDNKWLKASGWYKDGTVIGVQDQAEHGELASAFILYVLEEK